MKNCKGITLIALVVTIVVLLILAAVSISMLTGENGILNQAKSAKEETEQAKCEELVTLAINSLIGENLGDASNITPFMIAEEINKMENREDVYPEGETFPTNMIFQKENRKVLADVSGAKSDSYDGIYNVPGLEGKIAPTELFDYEYDSINKTAKITRIKPQYCNKYGYNPDTDSNDYEDTNYEIRYEGITDTLVIPYQVEKNGEMYTITEVSLLIQSLPWDRYRCSYEALPAIENIIYPNTVITIYCDGGYFGGNTKNSKLKRVILPSEITSIPNLFFESCTSLKYISIPSKVTSIGNRTFLDCKSLSTISISNNVTSIGYEAFRGCNNLSNITIPNSVTSIGYNVFEDWTSSQTINIQFKQDEIPSGWNSSWNRDCSATINYLQENS